MMKLCLNCDTENALDTVFCSECGMSQTRAPTSESALTASGEEDMNGALEKHWWIFFVAIPVLVVCVPIVFYLCLCVLNPHPPSRCYLQF